MNQLRGRYLATPNIVSHRNSVDGLHIQFLTTHKHQRLDSRTAWLRRVEPKSNARNLREPPFVRRDERHAGLECRK